MLRSRIRLLLLVSLLVCTVCGCQLDSSRGDGRSMAGQQPQGGRSSASIEAVDELFGEAKSARTRRESIKTIREWLLEDASLVPDRNEHKDLAFARVRIASRLHELREDAVPIIADALQSPDPEVVGLGLRAARYLLGEDQDLARRFCGDARKLLHSSDPFINHQAKTLEEECSKL